MNWFKSFSKFHKVYFIFFLFVNIFFFLSPLYTNGTILDIINPLAILGLLSAVSGLLAAVYTARAEVTAYAWGVVNTCLYIFVSLSRTMYAEVILYVLYMLPMNCYGFYAWRKNALKAKKIGSESYTIEVRSLNKKQWIKLIMFIVVVWFIYSKFVYYLPNIIKNITGNTIPLDRNYLIDSFTATLTICAVIVSTQRFKETWYFWLLSDVVGIMLYLKSLMSDPIFSIIALSGALMWIQFTVNAIYGIILWKKIDRKQLSSK